MYMKRKIFLKVKTTPFFSYLAYLVSSYVNQNMYVNFSSLRLINYFIYGKNSYNKILKYISFWVVIYFSFYFRFMIFHIQSSEIDPLFFFVFHKVIIYFCFLLLLITTELFFSFLLHTKKYLK